MEHKLFKLESIATVDGQPDNVNATTRYRTVKDLGIDTDYSTDSQEEQEVLLELKQFIKTCQISGTHTWYVSPIDGHKVQLTRIE